MTPRSNEAIIPVQVHMILWLRNLESAPNLLSGLDLLVQEVWE